MFALAPRTRRSMALLPRTEGPFGLIPEGITELFDRLLAGLPEMPELLPVRGLTMEELEKEVVIRAELPGFEPAEVRAEVLGDRLMIEAEHREPAGEAKEGEEKTERVLAHVRRVVTLPPEVEPDRAEAIYRNGVLTVHVPRRPEALARRIEVKT